MLFFLTRRLLKEKLVISFDLHYQRNLCKETAVEGNLPPKFYCNYVQLSLKNIFLVGIDARACLSPAYHAPEINYYFN